MSSALSTPPVLFPPDQFEPEVRLRHRTRTGLWLIAALLAVFVLLSFVLRIGGAVIGSGQVSVESRIKTIIHPTGGVLTAMFVHEGDHVRAGQTLLRLDTAVTAEGAAYAALSVDQLEARQARLEAERDGERAIQWPASLDAKINPSAQQAIEREQRVFDLRRRERESSIALLGQRVRQYEQQIASYNAQISALRQQRTLIGPELSGLRALYAKRLTPLSRINELERTAVNLDGSSASLNATIAETRAKIAETREQMLNVGQTIRADAGTELAQVLASLNDQQVRRASATSELARSTITAPAAGVVNSIAYTTTGSAVPANQPLMQIVPDEDLSTIEAQIRIDDIDQVHVGQAAKVRFSSLNRQVTPEIDGKVSFVSPERSSDERTGAAFYRIRVSVRKEDTRAKVGQLTSGMPAEVFVQTDDRSVFSWIVKPLSDILAHAMRDS